MKHIALIVVAALAGAWMIDLPRVDRPISGIERPPTRSAENAAIADDEQVIGVLVNGYARAYLISVMSPSPSHHVVNDVLADQSISVTYCGLYKTCAVFSDAKSRPLKIGIAGLSDEGMLIDVDGASYSHAGGKCPIPAWNYQIMSWKEWRTLHPNSDLYAGD
jgi:hypothetical protein